MFPSKGKKSRRAANVGVAIPSLVTICRRDQSTNQTRLVISAEDSSASPLFTRLSKSGGALHDPAEAINLPQDTFAV